MSAAIETAAIISTGDEIVGGRTVDTNSSYLADRLASLAIDVVSITTVGDYPGRIEWAWKTSLAHADVVISTGGLGPTADDLTNETLARVAGVDLELNEEEAEKIRELFARLNRPMPDNNLKQAMLPVGAEVVLNELGTAPGYRLVIPTAGRNPVAIVLPGVPREMKAMVEGDLIPWLAAQRGEGQAVMSRTFQTFGMSESALDEALADLELPDHVRLSFRASFPQISVRVGVVASETEARSALEDFGGRIAGRLGSAVYAEGDTTMEAEVGRLLREHDKSLATAESCTGGLIGNRLTNVAGSSEYYLGGLVAYSNDVKQKSLDVSASTLSMFGAVSEETAGEMAVGARAATGADIAIATTGIAGPDGGTEEKPVGTVAIAMAADGLADDGVRSQMYQLWGNREWVKILTSQIALDWIRRFLVGLDPLESNFGRRVRPKS